MLSSFEDSSWCCILIATYWSLLAMNWSTWLTPWTKEHWLPNLWLRLVSVLLFWESDRRIVHYLYHLILLNQLQYVNLEWLHHAISGSLFWDWDLQTSFNLVRSEQNFFVYYFDRKMLVLSKYFSFLRKMLPGNSEYYLEAHCSDYVQNVYIYYIIHTRRGVALCTVIQTFGFFRLLFFRGRCKLCRLC